MANGEVDGWVSYVTNEPITVKSKGFDNHAMLFADFKLPLVAEQTEEAKALVGLVVSEDTKKNGLFTMTQALVDEIYQEQPELKA